MWIGLRQKFLKGFLRSAVFVIRLFLGHFVHQRLEDRLKFNLIEFDWCNLLINSRCKALTKSFSCSVYKYSTLSW